MAQTNRDQVTPLGPGVVDRGAYNYGGDPNGASDAANKLNDQGLHAQGRQGEQIGLQNANEDRNMSLGDRGKQLGMADMMRARAMGKTPSIAQMQGDRQMGQAAAEQSSAAAGARGPAAMALAQQGAAANTASMQSNISNSTQINAANERMQAEQAASGAYNSLRSSDQAQQGQDFSQSAAQAQMNAQQRQQNDAYQLNNQQQAIGVQGMQLSADMNRDAAEQAGHFNAAGLQEQKNAAHDSSVMGYVNAGIQGASALGSAAAMFSDEQTKVPVSFGQSRGIAPIDTSYGRSSDESVSMARLMAHQALDRQQAEAASARATSAAGIAGGPNATAGMQALRDRDAEDLGLIQAKQRNGVDLSEKEEASQASLRHRAGQDKAAAAKDTAKADPKADSKAKGDSKAEAISGIKSGVSGIGNALAASARPSANPFQYSAPHQASLQGPAPLMQMTSDEEAKAAADAPSGGGGKAGGMGGAMSSLKGVGAALQASVGGGKEFHYQPPERHELDSNMMQSDDKTKVAKDWTISDAGNTVGMHYLGKEKPGEQMHADGVHGAMDDAEGRKQISASLSGRTPHFTVGTGSNESAGYGEGEETGGNGHDDSAKAKPKPRPQVSMASRLAPKHKMTDAEAAALARQADDMLAGSRAMLSSGPSVTTSDDRSKLAAAWDQGHAAAVADVQKLGGMSAADLKRHDQPVAKAVRGMKADAWDEGHRGNVGTLGKEMPQAEMADAARSMRATPYAYKPEFAGKEGQQPGEVNVGPVAQEMQKSPVAATAVKQDGPNGIRAIDIPKFTKVLGGVAASQQEQLDEQQRQISMMASRLRSKR